MKSILAILLMTLSLLYAKDDLILDEYFEKNGQVMLLIEPKSGKIERANESAARFYGYPKEKLESMGIQEINMLTPEQVAKERELARSEKRNYFIFRHKLADGSVKRVEVYSHPIEIDSNTLLFSTIHDVSNLELAEQTVKHYSESLEKQVDIKTKEILEYERGRRNQILAALAAAIVVIVLLAYNIKKRRKNEEQLRNDRMILDSIGAYVYTKDLEGRYTYANRLVCELFRTPLDGVIGTDDSKYFSLEISDDLKQNDNLVLREGKTIETEECNVIAASGEVRYYFVAKKPLRDSSGRVTGMFGVSTDVTQHREMEDELKELTQNLKERVDTEVTKRMKHEQLLIQQSKMAAMGEMISTIAHQWKQPLNMIALFSQQINDVVEYDGADPQKLSEITQKIMVQVEFMGKTMNDFRDFFKPSHNITTFKTCELAKEVYRLTEAKMKKLQVALEIEEHQCFVVSELPNEFKQVIFNIYGNACDVFEERKTENRKIALFFEKRDGLGVMKIRDNGGGIPDELLPDKLFESYISTKGEKGTGVGLHISRMIIEEKFHGKLWAHNVDGGAEFVIELPIL